MILGQFFKQPCC